jgi:ATP-dependent Clp protease ATP-binding subunit ClpA
MKELERHFRPEFINRLDEVVVFRPLTRDDMKEIIDIESEGREGAPSPAGLDLELTRRPRTS